MENSVRSEKSRQLVIHAALTILSRDGASRLTIDAIAREAGISKGGVLHHFRTKQAVLIALLDHQRAVYAQFAEDFRNNEGRSSSEPILATQLSVLRAASNQPKSVAMAILGAITEDPALLDELRNKDVDNLADIRAEATDGDMAVLRWVAARGLLWPMMFNMCPMSNEQRDYYFSLIMDPARWNAVPVVPAPAAEAEKPSKSRKK